MTFHTEDEAMPRWPHALMLLAMASVAVLIAAGCSASGSGPHVASLPGGQGHGPGTVQLTQAQSDQDMVNFARCMRSHGVQVPDPFHRPGHSGLSIEIPSETAAARPAFAACTHFIEPIIQMKNAGAIAEAAPRLHALTRYAQCMRSRDIAMLDPNPEGQLNLGTVPGITGNFGRYSPQFRAADSTCRHLLPAGVHDDGTGP